MMVHMHIYKYIYINTYKQEWRPYPVSKITTLSKDVKAFLIALPSEDHETVSTHAYTHILICI
jgi:hypothetical protein